MRLSWKEYGEWNGGTAMIKGRIRPKTEARVMSVGVSKGQIASKRYG